MAGGWLAGSEEVGPLSPLSAGARAQSSLYKNMCKYSNPTPNETILPLPGLSDCLDLLMKALSSAQAGGEVSKCLIRDKMASTQVPLESKSCHETRRTDLVIFFSPRKTLWSTGVETRTQLPHINQFRTTHHAHT